VIIHRGFRQGVAALVLILAAPPFALLTWWSVVTPLLGMLIVLIGWFALRNPASSAEEILPAASERRINVTRLTHDLH